MLYVSDENMIKYVKCTRAGLPKAKYNASPFIKKNAFNMYLKTNQFFNIIGYILEFCKFYYINYYIVFSYKFVIYLF